MWYNIDIISDKEAFRMYIGSIAGKESSLSGSYSYYKRGVQVPLQPDLYPDVNTGNIDIRSGNLFNMKKVGWRWTTLFDVGVDIVLELNKPCYVDRIVLSQELGSGVGAVEVLCETDQNPLHCAGRIDAATGQALEQKELTVTVGDAAEKIVIRLISCFRNIVIESLDIIAGVFDCPVIYPLPRQMECENKIAIANNELQCIVLPDHPSEDTVFASSLLKEKIVEITGREVSVEKIKDVKSLKDTIVLCNLNESVAMNIVLKEKPLSEGYGLYADSDTVYLTGADRRGLVYGVETVLSFMKNGYIPVCNINDYPRMEFRGFHMGLPARDEIPFFKRLIRYVLAPMRYNTIFLEFAGGMRFDRHPEINQMWIEGNEKAKKGEWPPFPHGSMVAGGSVLEKSEVADLVEYARSYGVDVIPEVQSLSHVQYITVAHPEIAERAEVIKSKDKYDLNKEDIPPSEFYAHSYCPSNEKSYEIIYDLIDEIVDVVKPKEYVHMGHDEVYQIGICPVCKSFDPADLFAKHVNRMHEYLSKKNLKMMIWGDMLHDATQYKTPPAIDKIPKDIVMLDFIWYFHFDKNLEDRLLNHGFKVIMGNMYSSHYPRYEKRIVKDGMIGAQVSTWCRIDEYTLGFMGKIYDIIYSANMLWNDSYRSDARLIYDKIIADRLPDIRSQIHGEKYPTRYETKKSVPLKLPESQSAALIPEELLTAINTTGMQNIRNVFFDLSKPQVAVSQNTSASVLPAPVDIPVNGYFDSFVFLHTAGKNVEILSFKPLKKIGGYTITFEDGTKEYIPIEYGGNILVWSKRHATPMGQQYYRHEGYKTTYLVDPYIQTKTVSGSDVTVYGYEWINPRKDTAISSITLSAEGNADAPVILLAVTGIKI